MHALLSTAIISAALLMTPLGATARAQNSIPPVSQCMALAQAIPGATYADFTPDDTLPVETAAGPGEVHIRYSGHSTYVITTPAGVTIATDFSDWSGGGFVPRVATMNKAHSSHFTLTPDEGIEHVLPGWGSEAQPADHDLVVEDVYIRNVTTDIRAYGAMEADANSIFIFEVADLCIGHLGHLHHPLDDTHYAEIGRLDIVMVPVDGGLTLSHEAMTGILKRLHTSIVLPMHRRGRPLSQFITMMGEGFATDYLAEDGFTVSLRSLPRRPTIIVPQGV
jgi:L-ascorbate metabolism protein UlaG (beta-lactamase superfamily)